MLLLGRLGGVAADVVSDETDQRSREINPLILYTGKLKNLIITPHIAGATLESMQAAEEYLASKFIQTIYRHV
jgi:D-3-phosphoglycerate dehydrogenase